MSHKALGDTALAWSCETCGKHGVVRTDHENLYRAEKVAEMAHDAMSPKCGGNVRMSNEP